MNQSRDRERAGGGQAARSLTVAALKSRLSRFVGTERREDNLGEYGRFAAGVTLRVFGVFISLLSAIVTSRGLGVDGRGLLYTCLSAAQITAQVLAIGMPSAVVLVVAPRPALALPAIRRALTAAAGAGFVTLLFTGVVFRLVPPSWLHPVVIRLGPLVAGLVATQVLLWWSSSLTQALGAVDRIPLFEVIHRSTTVTWAYCALFLIKVSFTFFLGSLILVDGLVAGVWMAYVRSIAPSEAGAPAWPREWKHWSLRAYFPLALYSGVRRSDALLLTSIAGVRATGLYSIAVQVMDTCQIAPVFLGQKALYAFSSGRGDSAPLRRLRRLLPFAVIGAMVLAGLTGSIWAGLLFGKDFSTVGPIVLALAAGGGALAWEMVAVQEVNAAGYPLRLTFVWLACFAAAVVLLMILIPLWGATGAGIAISISYIALAVMVYRVRQKLRKATAKAQGR
jgi:O-antigen/teichoic acid export membrane protein